MNKLYAAAFGALLVAVAARAQGGAFMYQYDGMNETNRVEVESV